MQEKVVRKIGPAKVLLGDVIEGMAPFPKESFDLAIVDPPYGASSNSAWILPRDHSLEGFGGAWKLASHTWDKLRGIEGLEFTVRWLTELKRLVKPTGSIWIHSTYHNSGIVNIVCQLLGLEIINEVVWFKRNAFPNLSNRRLTASHETILWVHTGKKKRRYRFNYNDARSASFSEDRIKEPGKQLRTVWDIPNNKERSELLYGQHPTQKPLRLTERLLLISGLPGGELLVPFVGSGTEVVAGIRYGMKPTGFETDKKFFDIACKRITHELRQQTMEFGHHAPKREDVCKLELAQ